MRRPELREWESSPLVNPRARSKADTRSSTSRREYCSSFFMNSWYHVNLWYTSNNWLSMEEKAEEKGPKRGTIWAKTKNEWRGELSWKKPSRAQPAWHHLQASWTVRRWWHSEEKDNLNLKISIKDKSPSIVDPPALLQGMSVQDWKESPKMQMVVFHRQRPATNSRCDIS